MKVRHNKNFYNHRTLETYRLRGELLRAARLIGLTDNLTLHPTVINEIGKHIGTPRDIIASVVITSLYARSIRVKHEPTISRRVV